MTHSGEAVARSPRVVWAPAPGAAPPAGGPEVADAVAFFFFLLAAAADGDSMDAMRGGVGLRSGASKTAATTVSGPLGNRLRCGLPCGRCGRGRGAAFPPIAVVVHLPHSAMHFA